MNQIADFYAARQGIKIQFGIACPDPEKFREIKRGVYSLILTGQVQRFTQIKRPDFQFRQISVWIMIAGMILIPFPFPSLFHDVIPRIYITLIKAVHDIIRRPGQMQYFGLFAVVTLI